MSQCNQEMNYSNCMKFFLRIQQLKAIKKTGPNGVSGLARGGVGLAYLLCFLFWKFTTMEAFPTVGSKLPPAKVV